MVFIIISIIIVCYFGFYLLVSTNGIKRIIVRITTINYNNLRTKLEQPKLNIRVTKIYEKKHVWRPSVNKTTTKKIKRRKTDYFYTKNRKSYKVDLFNSRTLYKKKKEMNERILIWNLNLINILPQILKRKRCKKGTFYNFYILFKNI